MIAFADESKRVDSVGVTYSVGFFITGNFESAYELLINEYWNIIRRYNLRIGKGEIKFSTILNSLARRLGQLSREDITRIFRPTLTKLEAYGYCVSFVFRHYEIFDITRLIREDINYVTSPKTLREIRRIIKSPSYYPPQRTLSILSMILILWTLYNVNTFVVDYNFIAKKDLEFLNGSLRILRKRASVKFCTPTLEKGIFIADFVAGLAKYIIEQKAFKLLVNDICIISPRVQRNPATSLSD